MKKICIYKNDIIYCIFFKKILKKCIYKYIPGILGYYIYNNISEKAWNLWIIYQTKIINENLLNTKKKIDRNFLKIKMMLFLFN